MVLDLDFLSDPDGFVGRHADAPGFRGPVVVALLAGVAGPVASLPSVSFAVGAMPPEARPFGAIAYVTAAVGTLVDMVLSVIGGAVINQLILGDPTAVVSLRNALYVVVALAFGVVTSVVSGLYPAFRAATQNPVDALRK